jgi:5-(carboxyamino)imidazole ribonucleotide synthase
MVSSASLAMPVESSLRPILPGATLGVLGGGQLGRMWAQEAQRMGYETVVLDPDELSPAGVISHLHLKKDYLDEDALKILSEQCQAVTTEFENVPAHALEVLKEIAAPGACAVSVAQDRAKEKAHFVQCGVPVAPHAVIENIQQLKAVSDDLLPGILKTARMGYDGKGQVRVNNRDELEDAWGKLQNALCVLEKLLPLQDECSVIVARSRSGQIVHLPVQRNLHRAGILAVTEVFDGNIETHLAQQAIEAAKAVAHGLNYVGVLCVEFFVLNHDGQSELVVNEIAPRPHNSGHYSQDACDVSQFELQVRCMTNLPLVQPRLHSAALMLNLLGDLWFKDSQQSQEPVWAQVLALPGTHLHLYGKTEARIGRKMGHLNITAQTAQEAKKVALQAAAILGIEPF